jgi:hypothetical protein
MPTFFRGRMVPSCTFLCILWYFLPTAGFSQQEDALLTQDIINVLHAKNAGEMAKIAERRKEYLVDIARAYRSYELGIPRSENQLYARLPRSSEQISRLYLLTTLYPEHGREELVNLYQNYYKTIFALAPKHPTEIRRLFAIVANYGGKMNEGEEEWFCDLLKNLYEKVPREYLRALADEPKYRIVGLTCAVSCEERQ